MAALIGIAEDGEATAGTDDMGALALREQVAEDLDGVPIFDDRPIDFSGGAGLDGLPMVCVRVCA